MKKVGIYSTRGQVLEGTSQKIELFDGRFDTGYRVVSFVIWASDCSSSSNDCVGALSTESYVMPSSGNMTDASDNTQIAWSAVQAGSSGFNNPASIVDSDNLVIQDLFITGQSGGSSITLNYLIEMEKYEFSDWRGALAMVRNRSQT
jgi:hypothetical protein